MPIVGLERVVFYRERAASTYNPWTFGMVMASTEIPYIIFQVRRTNNISDRNSVQ